MVEFAAQRSQARFYIAKAIPVSELGKAIDDTVPTREASRPRISAVPSDATAKLAIRRNSATERHRAALVHEPLSAAAKLSLEPVAVQIAARQKSSQTADARVLFGSAKYFTGHLCRLFMPTISRSIMRRPTTKILLY